MGTEFNNEVVERLLANNGIEHLVTSGWAPETNGKVERLNRTVIDCLRKHSEQNSAIWPQYIPMVMIAYNSHIHSTTGFAPFELVFGKRMNTFESWSCKKPLEHTIALRNRADEIQSLINKKHQKAIASIQEKQVVQKGIQDSHKVIEDELPAGTMVMLKKEGLLKKLEPKYDGLYKVIRRTGKFNYVIEDADDNKTQKTVPLRKLKIVERDKTHYEQSAEVEEILKRRTRNNQFEYWVVWKKDKSKSWVPEKDFNSMKLVDEFNSNNPPRKRVRPKTIINKILLFIFYFIFLFDPADGFKIKKQFSYCDLTGDVGYWDGYADCDNIDIKQNSTGNFILFSKMHDIVNGDGYQCFKTKHTYKFNEDFLGYRTDSLVEDIIALSRRDCLNMIESKM